MVRTVAMWLLCIGAVLWLPVWAQIAFFVCAILFTKYRLVLLVPALYADVLYAPTHSIRHLTMTLIVGTLLILWYLITTQTRIGESHVEITK